MARSKAAATKAADAPTISDEAMATAQAQAATDAEIMAKLRAATAERIEKRRARTVTLQELFGQLVSLAASATGKTFRNGVPAVSEQSAVKILELAMGWALNSRNGAVNPILEGSEPEETGEAQSDSPELPIPDELIEAASDAVEE